MSDYDPVEYLQEEKIDPLDYLQEEKPKPEGFSLKKALEKALEASDYIGGATRGAIALGLQGVTGKNLVSEDELKNAAQMGQFFPSTNELLERGDILKDSPKTRAAVGFVGDILADPTTYTGLGLLSRPAGSLLRGIGKKVYKSGLKEVDQAARLARKTPVSDLLWNRGIWGTGRGVAEGAIDAAEELAKRRSELIYAADMAKAKANMGRAMYPALEVISEIKSNPATREMTPELQRIVKRFMKEPFPSTRVATDWKSDIYNMVGSPSYQMFKQTPKGKQFQKELARGLKEEVERAANAVKPGLGDEIAKVNDEWGTLLSTAKAFENQAIKGAKKNILTSADPYIMAIGALGYGTTGSGAWLAAKKAADLFKTPVFRTGSGIALKNLSESKVLYPALKRLIIDSGNPEASPWSLMGQKRFNAQDFLNE